MKLFLASEAKHPLSLKKLEKFVGGFDGKKLAYIPTALNGEYYGAWKGGESIGKVLSLRANVSIIELEDNCFSDVLTRLSKADIIWVAGGWSGYLLYWIRRVGLAKALPGFLQQGAVYVGSSAGSMICGPTQYSAEWYLDEPEPGAGLVPGLGLVDFEIYPHYQEKLLPRIKKLWQSGRLYLLKDGEAITVVDGKVTVLGKKRVLKGEKI